MEAFAAEEVDEFIWRHGIDKRVSVELRTLNPKIQRLVMYEGALKKAPDPSAVLMKRIQAHKSKPVRSNLNVSRIADRLQGSRASRLQGSGASKFARPAERGAAARAIKFSRPTDRREAARVDHSRSASWKGGDVQVSKAPERSASWKGGEVLKAYHSQLRLKNSGEASRVRSSSRNSAEVHDTNKRSARPIEEVEVYDTNQRSARLKEEVEDFIEQNGIHANTAEEFRRAEAKVQRMVLDEGRLNRAFNTSAVLGSRMQQAKARELRKSNKAEDRYFEESVEQFLSDNNIDRVASEELRSEDPEIQWEVVRQGEIWGCNFTGRGCKNPSAALIMRIKHAREVLLKRGMLLRRNPQKMERKDSSEQRRNEKALPLEDERISTSSQLAAIADAEGDDKGRPKWKCPRCSNENLHWRQFCNTRWCKMPKTEGTIGIRQFNRNKKTLPLPQERSKTIRMRTLKRGIHVLSVKGELQILLQQHIGRVTRRREWAVTTQNVPGGFQSKVTFDSWKLNGRSFLGDVVSTRDRAESSAARIACDYLKREISTKYLKTEIDSSEQSERSKRKTLPNDLALNTRDPKVRKMAHTPAAQVAQSMVLSSVTNAQNVSGNSKDEESMDRSSYTTPEKASCNRKAHMEDGKCNEKDRKVKEEDRSETKDDEIQTLQGSKATERTLNETDEQMMAKYKQEREQFKEMQKRLKDLADGIPQEEERRTAIHEEVISAPQTPPELLSGKPEVASAPKTPPELLMGLASEPSDAEAAEPHDDEEVDFSGDEAEQLSESAAERLSDFEAADFSQDEAPDFSLDEDNLATPRRPFDDSNGTDEDDTPEKIPNVPQQANGKRADCNKGKESNSDSASHAGSSGWTQKAEAGPDASFSSGWTQKAEAGPDASFKGQRQRSRTREASWTQTSRSHWERPRWPSAAPETPRHPRQNAYSSDWAQKAGKMLDEKLNGKVSYAGHQEYHDSDLGSSNWAQKAGRLLNEKLNGTPRHQEQTTSDTSSLDWAKKAGMMLDASLNATPVRQQQRPQKKTKQQNGNHKKQQNGNHKNHGAEATKMQNTNKHKSWTFESQNNSWEKKKGNYSNWGW